MISLHTHTRDTTRGQFDILLIASSWEREHVAISCVTLRYCCKLYFQVAFIVGGWCICPLPLSWTPQTCEVELHAKSASSRATIPKQIYMWIGTRRARALMYTASPHDALFAHQR